MPNINDKDYEIKYYYTDPCTKDEVLLSIDKSTEYKNVIEIIDKLKSIGITKINLNSMSEGEKL